MTVWQERLLQLQIELAETKIEGEYERRESKAKEAAEGKENGNGAYA